MEFCNSFMSNIQRALACLCCLICAGPVLFIIGLSLLLSSPFSNTREDNLAEMNKAITSWNTQYRFDFKNVTVVVTSDNTNGKYVMSQQTPSYKTEVPDYDGLDPWDPLYYKSFSINDLIPPTTFSPNAYQNIMYTYNQSDETSNFTVNVPLFLLEVERSNNEDSSKARDSCQQNDGFYSNGRCETYWKLTSLCVKVTKSYTGYIPDTDYKDIGCEYSQVDGPSEDTRTPFMPGIYTKLRYNSQILSTPQTFNGIIVSTRSAEDPYITAQYVTEGSLNFGLSKGSIAATGLIIMIIGIIFMVPCCAFTALFVYMWKKKR